MIDLKQDGTFILNQDFFNYTTGLTMTNEKFNKLFGPHYIELQIKESIQFHMDIAASIQSVTEDIMIMNISRSISDWLIFKFMFSWWSGFKLCCEWQDNKRKNI